MFIDSIRIVNDHNELPAYFETSNAIISVHFIYVRKRCMVYIFNGNEAKFMELSFLPP